ncbi:MAG TPA: DUF3048 domain-containing protein [Actinomycetales bacterium]|nr:DUF3048 domain-containing protein [Actinomycetales bacterium]
MNPLDRRTLLLGALGTAGIALTGCSDGKPAAKPTGTPSPSPSPTPSVTADTRPRWPLTGQLLSDPAKAKHTAVAVKVPDNRREHPQVGLDKADIVVVELDGYRDSSGYSGTRLMPIFHSHLPDDVAPVRSIRPVDVPMLAPIGAIVGNTGATGWVGNYVKHYGAYVEGTKTYMATKGTGSYSIDPARVRKYQGRTYYDRAVVCHPKALAKQTTKFRQGPSQLYLPFATGETQPSTVDGRGARTVQVPWKQGDTYDMTYSFDDKSGRYLRSMPWGKHVLANGTRVATDNVLVILASQQYKKIYSGAGGVEPVHGVINTKGTFIYAHGGRYVTGTWSKGAINALFTFTLDDGSPLVVAPGQTYIELARTGAKVRLR